MWSWLATRTHICLASAGRSATLYPRNGEDPSYRIQFVEGAGRPAFVGGIVSQKKWMWRVPGMSGVKWNALNATA